MASFRRVAKNVAFNWSGFAVQIAVAFFLTPFVIHRLGDARYGVWALTISLTGYYGLLDLGFRAGLTQHITRALAVGDLAQANRIVSSGLAALSVCALLLLCASVGFAFWAPALIHIPSELVQEVFWCVLIIGASVAAQFVFFPFSAVLTATHRFDISNVIGVSVRLLTAGGTIFVLSNGGGLIGLSVVTAAGNVLDYAARLVFAFRVLPGLGPSLTLADVGTNRTLLAFGLWSMVSLASSRLISYSDALVVGAFMPIAAVAWFALAANLVNHFSSVFVPIGQVFFPIAAELDARNDTDGLVTTYLRATRVLTMLVTIAAVVAGALATDFYRLWLGPRYVIPGDFQPVPLLFQVLLIAAACSATQRIGCQFLIAAGRLRLLAGVTACEAAVNLVLSLMLVHRFGLVGVAIGTLVPAIAFQLCVQPLLVCRHLRCSPLLLVRHVGLRAVIIAITMSLFLRVTRSSLNVNGWNDLAVVGLLALAASVAVIIVVGLTAIERRSMIAATTRLIRSRAVAGSDLDPSSQNESADHAEHSAALTIR